MTALIKVHAQSRGGYWAESKIPPGRTVCAGGITMEEAVQNCALRIVGAPQRVGRDGNYDLLQELNIWLRQRHSENRDEELFEMEAAD